MLAQDVGNVVETMQVMVQAEKTVGDFYKACSESFGHDKEFWIHLAEEEYFHAEVIDRLSKSIAAKPHDFEPGKMSPGEALQSFAKKVRSYLATLSSGGFTEAQALFTAHLIESTFAEHKYTEAIRTSNVQYLTELKKLTEDEANHKALISRKMRASKANT